MKTGDSIFIKATVLRVEGKRLDAQTADGQLIQTDVSNVMTEEKQLSVEARFGRPSEVVIHEKQKAAPKAKTAERKSVGLEEHKAELNAPENKSAPK